MLGPIHDAGWRRFVGIVFLLSSPLPIAGTALALQQGRESALVGGPIFWLVLVVLFIQVAKFVSPSIRKEMEIKRKSAPEASISKRDLVSSAVVAGVVSVILEFLGLSPIGPVSTTLLLLAGFWWGFAPAVRRVKVKSEGRESPPAVR